MKCVKCGENIPPKRLQILPKTKVCVNCSSATKLVGVPIVVGKGDHTYNDISIMTPETYNRFHELQIKRGKYNIENNNAS